MPKEIKETMSKIQKRKTITIVVMISGIKIHGDKAKSRTTILVIFR